MLKMCSSIRGCDDVDWREASAINKSGGLLCFWRKDILEVNHTFIGSGFLGLKGTWEVDVPCTVVLNVYAPCEIEGCRGDFWISSY